MLFNSIRFLLFFPTVFILYFLCKKKYRYLVLLFASYVFYMAWNWKLGFLILGVTIVTYLSGLGIKRSKQEKGKKLFLIIGIVLTLGVLVFFKYTNFLLEMTYDISNLFHLNTSLLSLKIILPVGISFYTFQTISYMVDCYKGNIQVEENFLYYALFVAFFPQLVAGPIERASNLLPKLHNENNDLNIQNVIIGLRRMLIGFVKKIAIADMIGQLVDRVFNQLDTSNGLMILAGIFLFSIQILADFSGYSDIAIGTAKCFNIDLCENFDHPYRSHSIQEFWRRWHISLSRFLKDYVYIPLGGNKKGKFMTILNIMIVFFLSGLWHGASYTFILWGVLHGVYQIIWRVTKKKRDEIYKFLKVPNKLKEANQMILTYLLVTFAFIFFRINSLSDFPILFKNLFTLWDLNCFSTFFTNFSLSIGKTIYLIGVIALFVVIDSPFLFKSQTRSFSIARKIVYVGLIWLVLGAFIYLQSGSFPSNFIYFQF